MSTLFFGRVARLRRFFLAGRGARDCCFPSEKRTEHHEKIRALEVDHHVDHLSPSFSEKHPSSDIYTMYNNSCI